MRLVSSMMTLSKKIKNLAIIGLGSIGRRHLRLLKEVRPDISVTLIRSGKGQSWPEESLAKRTVYSIDQALSEGIQAAIISTPASLHIPQALEFVTADIPLLIEKPLSNNLLDVEKLKTFYTNNKNLILIGYVLRYSLASQYFHKLLTEECIGIPLFVRVECSSYLPAWRPEQNYKATVSAQPELGGGVLLELSHELDYVNWLFGPFKKVKAALHNSGILDISVEDTADLLLSNIRGLPVSIHLDFCCRQTTRHCTVQGDKGSLCWDILNNQVRWIPNNGAPQAWDFPMERDTLFVKQLTHFFACIEQGKHPRVTLDDGIAALQLVDAARNAHYNERTVEL